MKDRLNSPERENSGSDGLKKSFRGLVDTVYLLGTKHFGWDKEIAQAALGEENPETRALMIELVGLRKVQIPQGADEFKIPNREMEIAARLVELTKNHPTLRFVIHSDGRDYGCRIAKPKKSEDQPPTFVSASEFRNRQEYTTCMESIKKHGAAARLATDLACAGIPFVTLKKVDPATGKETIIKEGYLIPGKPIATLDELLGRE